MSTNVMKSLRFTAFGPPSVLRFEEIFTPALTEGPAMDRHANMDGTGSANRFSLLATRRPRFPPRFRIPTRNRSRAGRLYLSCPPPEKPPVPNEELPETTPPVTDPPPDPKTDPKAVDPDDAQIEPPKDDAFKKK